MIAGGTHTGGLSANALVVGLHFHIVTVPPIICPNSRTDPRRRRLSRTHLLHAPRLALPPGVTRSSTTRCQPVGAKRARMDRLFVPRHLHHLDRAHHQRTRGAGSERDPLRSRKQWRSCAHGRAGPPVGHQCRRERPTPGDRPVLLWGCDAPELEGGFFFFLFFE